MFYRIPKDLVANYFLANVTVVSHIFRFAFREYKFSLSGISILRVTRKDNSSVQFLVTMNASLQNILISTFFVKESLISLYLELLVRLVIVGKGVKLWSRRVSVGWAER